MQFIKIQKNTNNDIIIINKVNSAESILKRLEIGFNLIKLIIINLFLFSYNKIMEDRPFHCTENYENAVGNSFILCDKPLNQVADQSYTLKYI